MDEDRNTLLPFSKVAHMQTLQHSYRGFTLMMELNWDRLLFLAMICASLLCGAWLGSL